MYLSFYIFQVTGVLVGSMFTCKTRVSVHLQWYVHVHVQLTKTTLSLFALLICWLDACWSSYCSVSCDRCFYCVPAGMFIAGVIFIIRGIFYCFMTQSHLEQVVIMQNYVMVILWINDLSHCSKFSCVYDCCKMYYHYTYFHKYLIIILIKAHLPASSLLANQFTAMSVPM